MTQRNKSEFINEGGILSLEWVLAFIPQGACQPEKGNELNMRGCLGVREGFCRIILRGATESKRKYEPFSGGLGFVIWGEETD